ncbi:MAG: DeoR family transcriptional regulator [Candidatus Omnitrophica bacterium]|nr:DeoR family transcriptional regulator [Candidatus Omnitrophota bacterium]
MVRTVDYESRRRSVLAAAINKYIQSATPVASEDIAAGFNVSSATIRNIFSELEEAGLLTHPYTSGGRIPTNKGYRYYVDLLLSKMKLLEDEKGRIVKEYKKELKRLEDALEETSGIISRITHYAGIVSFLDWQDKFFYRGISHILEMPEFSDSRHIRTLIRMIEDKERLLDIINRDFSGKVKVYIGRELECPEMENCSLVVSQYRFKQRPSGRLAVLGPVRMEYEHIIPAVEYISDVLSDVLEAFI